MTMERTNSDKKPATKYNTNLASDPDAFYFVYGCAAAGIPIGMFLVPDWAISSAMTYSTLLTAIASMVVVMHINKTRDLRGISVKMFHMQLCASAMRLTGTTWLNGYIPSDSSGDYMFQMLDIMVAIFSAYVVYKANADLQWSYYEEHDSFPYKLALWIGCLCGCCTHPSLHGRPLFDTTWNVSMFFESMTVAPQIWMFLKRPDVVVPACQSHWVFCFFINRLLNLMFWMRGYEQLIYHATWRYSADVVIACHILSLLLVAEFAFYYIKSLVLQSSYASMDAVMTKLMV